MKERSRSPNSGTIVFAIISTHIWDEPNQKEMCRSGNGGCVRTVGLGVACPKLSPVLFHHFFINKANQSSFSNAYICTMSNMWVEGKNVPSISGMHLLPNIRHLESLNEPNNWILHASLKALSREFRFLWIACELCGEADLGRKSVGKNERNALLRKVWGVKTGSWASQMKDVALVHHLYIYLRSPWEPSLLGADGYWWWMLGFIGQVYCPSGPMDPYLWTWEALRTVPIHLKETIPMSIFLKIQSRCSLQIGSPISPWLWSLSTKIVMLVLCNHAYPTPTDASIGST